MKRRIHDGKIRRNPTKENFITTQSFWNPTVHRKRERVSYAQVKCPKCEYVNELAVNNQKFIQFKCKCGQLLNFNIPN